MRPAVLALVLLLCGGSLVDAQTLRGRVLEEESRTPIAGALVELRNMSGATVASADADSIGEFLIRLRTPGRYHIHVSHPPYASSAPQLVALGRDDAITVELRLARTALPLRPLIVTSVRDPRLAGFHERMRQPGSGQFLTRAEIDVRPGARTTDLLREMHGVDIMTTGGSISRPRVNVVTMRSGVGVCSPTIYIDGIVVRQMPDSGVDDFLKPEMLEGAEVYTSAVSAPSSLQPRGGCGVVAFWTRPVGEVEKVNWRRVAMAIGAVASLGVLILLTQ